MSVQVTERECVCVCVCEGKTKATLHKEWYRGEDIERLLLCGIRKARVCSRDGGKRTEAGLQRVFAEANDRASKTAAALPLPGLSYMKEVPLFSSERLT